MFPFFCTFIVQLEVFIVRYSVNFLRGAIIISIVAVAITSYVTVWPDQLEKYFLKFPVAENK